MSQPKQLKRSVRIAPLMIDALPQYRVRAYCHRDSLYSHVDTQRRPLGTIMVQKILRCYIDRLVELSHLSGSLGVLVFDIQKW